MRTPWRYTLWNIPDNQNVYIPGEYEQLRHTAGTQSRAQDRESLSETELRRLCSRLELSKGVTADAVRLYQRLIRTNLVNNYLNGTMIAAAVYTACRKHRIPRTFGDIHSAAHVLVAANADMDDAEPRHRSLSSERAIQRLYNTVRDRFDQKYSPVGPEQFVQRYCDLLDLGTTVEEVAMVAINCADEQMLTGMAANTIAVGAIYYACEQMNQELTQRDLKYVTGSSTVSMRKGRDMIQDSLES